MSRTQSSSATVRQQTVFTVISPVEPGFPAWLCPVKRLARSPQTEGQAGKPGPTSNRLPRKISANHPSPNGIYGNPDRHQTVISANLTVTKR
jgi:hypothetical protein